VSTKLNYTINGNAQGFMEALFDAHLWIRKRPRNAHLNILKYQEGEYYPLNGNLMIDKLSITRHMLIKISEVRTKLKIDTQRKLYRYMHPDKA
jgi:hypothetical protein